MSNSVNVETPPRLNIKPAIHEQFYLWARPLVRNKVVLDAGCGDGLGTVTLAETAVSITGIDVDSAVIDFAKKHNSSGSTKYIAMDCTSLDFPTASFDVVICNALLEYLTEPRLFFKEAKRVLKDNGRIVCGTKNLARSLKDKDGQPLYRNHLQEYTAESLVRTMSDQFRNFEMFGERMRPKAESQIMDARARGLEKVLVALNIKHLIPVHIRRRVRRLITGVDETDICANDFYITNQSVDDALYIICIAEVM